MASIETPIFDIHVEVSAMAECGISSDEIQRVVDTADLYVTTGGLDPAAAVLRAQREALAPGMQSAITRAVEAHWKRRRDDICHGCDCRRAVATITPQPGYEDIIPTSRKCAKCVRLMGENTRSAVTITQDGPRLLNLDAPRWEANPDGVSGRMVRGYRHWRTKR